MANIGFIGTGTMGTAVAQLVSNNAGDCQLLFSNRTEEKAEFLAQDLLGAVSNNRSIAQNCDLIFLGVKPQALETVLREIAPLLARRSDEFMLVSMAAGVSIARIQEMAGGGYPVVRMMPNLPLMVGAGVVQYCATEGCHYLRQFDRWMAYGGMSFPITEAQMDAATAVTGCGPAFCAMFLEALADGGVLCGLSRDQALKYAAQTLIGTGELVLQGEMTPAQIKDQVCSPGGSTIQGVATLEAMGFRSAGISAVKSAFEASRSFNRS